MEENMLTPYEYIRMLIEKYGDETDLNKYDNLIGDYKQLFELVKRLKKENKLYKHRLEVANEFIESRIDGMIPEHYDDLKYIINECDINSTW